MTNPTNSSAQSQQGARGSRSPSSTNTSRRGNQTIINKTLVIIPDPAETAVPTHSKRAALRLQGLIVDEFPFDKRWDDQELLLNAMEQLPLRFSMHRIRFVKASYGTITPINLPNGMHLSGERLLRIAGQGSVYAQILPRENDASNSTSTQSMQQHQELPSNDNSASTCDEEFDQGNHGIPSSMEAPMQACIWPATQATVNETAAEAVPVSQIQTLKRSVRPSGLYFQIHQKKFCGNSWRGAHLWNQRLVRF